VRIIGIGELLWDIFDDTERLGGASFNFAAQARRMGHEVVFLSAVGDDERGRRALEALDRFRLPARFVRSLAGRPTGCVTVKVNAAGEPDYTIHRPAAYDFLELEQADYEELAVFEPSWIYFGTLHQADPRARALTRQVLEFFGEAQRFYDVNLRRNSYTAELLAELLPEADVVKLNEAEVSEVRGLLGHGAGDLEAFCRRATERFGWAAVCVTRGARGCAVLLDGAYAEIPGYPVEVVDTVGSGDAFAAAFLHGLGQGWSPEAIGDFANRVAALTASRPGALPEWTLEECRGLRRV
jgi:fructokinase